MRRIRESVYRAELGADPRWTRGRDFPLAKRQDAPYRSVRNASWTKRTCGQRETFVVVGVAFQRNKFDGIYLARSEGRGLLYAGKVERGFVTAYEKKLRAMAERLKSRTQPLSKKVKNPKAVWLEPGGAGGRRISRAHRGAAGSTSVVRWLSRGPVAQTQPTPVKSGVGSRSFTSVRAGKRPPQSTRHHPSRHSDASASCL